MQTLKSKEDCSINYIHNKEDSFLESRYAARSDDYFICYVSSFNGCNQGCKFCWLTGSGQTKMNPSDIEDFKRQIQPVLEHNAKGKNIRNTHFNFMARGEPLLNRCVTSGDVFYLLDDFAELYNLSHNVLISTIFPKQFKNRLVDSFGVHTPIIYYSYYSDDEKFKEKWMPNSSNVSYCLNQLSEYYSETGVRSKIHFGFIKGENDNYKTLDNLIKRMLRMSYIPQVNIVAYNPHDDSEESDFSEKACEYINNNLLSDTCQIIPRVGFDVKVSCGMFV